MDASFPGRRVLVAGLFHETHAFVEERTRLADFAVSRGRAMLAGEGDSSPLGGALACAREAGWAVVPAADYRAMPGGMVADEVVEAFWADLAGAWREDLDAVYLVLHGAMSSESFPDVEGEILRRLRGLPGAKGLPVHGVYDLHANVSPAMARLADVLVAYRENPHADAREAATRAAGLLERCLRGGEKPRMHLRQTGLVWVPGRTGTAEDPMATLERLAREAEAASPGVWAVNVAAGFAYGDTPDTGVSFQVAGTCGEAEAAEILDRLEQAARRLDAAEPGDRELTAAEAVEKLAREPLEGLTVLVEPSDNIGGGAPGDGTGLLRALVDSGTVGAAACLNDPAAVERLAGLPLGSRLVLPLGGRGSSLDPGPLEMEAELVSRSEGRFELEDKQSHLASVSGDTFDMGPCAVVRGGGVTVLLTSRKTPPFDLGQWRSQGIDPAGLRAIVVKAAVAHRRAYDPVAARMWWVETPGPCASRWESLPYRYLSPGQGPGGA